jgi:hypothetical protein
MSKPARTLAALSALLGLCAAAAVAAGEQVHGLWVWKGPQILASSTRRQQLQDFCRQAGVNEVYVSVFSHGALGETTSLEAAVPLLHRSGVRVEALLSSTDADLPGPHRDKLLAQVRAIVRFNAEHAGARFDGIHLDIEPQQRPENKGVGNLRFLPGLIAAYRAVRGVTEPAGLTVAADIQNKLLKASAPERAMLLQALPRYTLMMYELSSPTDGSSPEEKADKVRTASRTYLELAYRDLTGSNPATLVIALRTADYGGLLARMLQVLDAANSADPHYAGWARHSYNDVSEAQP